MAEAKTNIIIDALPDNVNMVERDRLLRSAQLVQDKNQLRQCVAILKVQYDEKNMMSRLQRLVTKMVLAQKYENWKAIYNKVGLTGGEFVLNITLEPYVWLNQRAMNSLIFLYQGMLNKECDLDRMNEFMQRLVGYMEPNNLRDIIGKLKRREIINKILGDRPIQEIVSHYIPSA